MSQVLKPKKGYKKVKGLFGTYDEIPQEWEIVPLNKYTTLKDGDWILEKNYSEKGVRLLQIGDMGLGVFLDKSQKYISKKTSNELKCTIIKQGKDILISRMPTPIGRACIAPVLPYPYIVAVDISILKYDLEKIYQNYLVYTLNHSKNLNNVKKYVAGTTRQRINRTNLESITIIIPPLPEQQKIASILSNIDNLIFNTEKIIDQNTVLKKGLMQKLLTRGINHKKFKKVHIIPRFLELIIPENWKYNTLDSISIEIKDGPMGFSLHNYDYKQKGIPILKVQNLKNLLVNKYNLSFISKEKHNELEKSQTKPLDIIISKTGIYLGVIGILPEDYGPANLNQALARINLKNKKYVKFVSMFLAYGLPQKILNIVGSSRTAQPGLRMSDIKNLIIPIPEQDEIKKITYVLSNIDSQITSQIQYKEKLERLKKSLMQKLLTGEVRVKV
ncbi:MAG: restriction endonuclease subunit S [Nitrosopumilus sp.]|nr:restriction endonuclease subunit S [Nitrosopumilus sp.]NRA05948.1 restriction endonuclease subunit S [Nitrosopumilus sp.]